MVLIRTIKNLITNRRLKRILNKAYQDEELIKKLSTVMGTQFYMDWIGRLYAVVNPYIKDGKWDQSQAFEYTESGYDTKEHVTQWIMQRLDLLDKFIQANNLFDLLVYNIEKLDDSGNYLFVIQPVTQPELLDNLKSLWNWSKWLVPIGLTIGLGFFIF